MDMLEAKHRFIRDKEDEDEQASANEEYLASLEEQDGKIDTSRLDPSTDMDVSEKSTLRKFSKYRPRKIDASHPSAKGFAGTSLKLLPNVRDSKIELGDPHEWFKLFGINKRVGTIITMYLGPNCRQNRYLTFQYKRLFKSIGGSVELGTDWDSELNKAVVKKYVKWAVRLKDLNFSTRPDSPSREVWSLKVRKY